MVGTNQVDFREDSGSSQIGREVLNVWNGVVVSGRDVVEAPVVPTWTPFAIGFGNHVEWRGPRTCRGAYYSHVKELVELSFGGSQLLG